MGDRAGDHSFLPSALFQMSAVYAELETRLTTGFGGKLGNLAMHRTSPPIIEQGNPAGENIPPALLVSWLGSKSDL